MRTIKECGERWVAAEDYNALAARLAEAERLLRWCLLHAKPGMSGEVMAFLRTADNAFRSGERWPLVSD